MRRLAAGALALWLALPAPTAAAEPPAPDPVIALSYRGAHRAYPLRVFSGRRQPSRRGLCPRRPSPPRRSNR